VKKQLVAELPSVLPLPQIAVSADRFACCRSMVLMMAKLSPFRVMVLLFILMNAVSATAPPTWMALESTLPTIPVPHANLRFRVMVVGFPKTGTRSIASIFTQAGYAAAHEPGAGQMAQLILAYRNGNKSRQDAIDWLRQQDARQPLELWSNCFLSSILDEVLEAFPTMRFILPLRWPIAWSESMYDQAVSAPPVFAPMVRALVGENHKLPKTEDSAHSCGRSWTFFNREICRVIPSRKWLTTTAIMSR
jgi:hypothetical protein